MEGKVRLGLKRIEDREDLRELEQEEMGCFLTGNWEIFNPFITLLKLQFQ